MRKPGWYFRLGSLAFRGGKRFAPAEKQTLPMAHKAYQAYLRKNVSGVTVPTPLLVVWSSQENAPAHVRPLGWGQRGGKAVPVRGARLAKVLKKANKPADPLVVAAMQKMLVGQSSRFQGPGTPLRRSIHLAPPPGQQQAATPQWQQWTAGPTQQGW
jgi:hypothetical protein